MNPHCSKYNNSFMFWIPNPCWFLTWTRSGLSHVCHIEICYINTCWFPFLDGWSSETVEKSYFMSISDLVLSRFI